MPEVQKIVHRALTNLNQTHLQSISIHSILKKNYDPGLDDLHLPLMEKYERFARTEGVIGLETFPHSYFTNGSSEGIFHLLSHYAVVQDLPIYQLDGEYQGYGEYLKTMGKNIEVIRTTRSDLKGHISKAKPGVIIISNPNSMAGFAYTDAFLQELAGHGHKLIVDLAYMGMTRRPLNLNMQADYITAVVGSLSKSFGLYYYRIGFCYSKLPIPSLYGNKWFKNALSIKIGEAVLDGVDLPALKEKYFKIQEEAIVSANDHHSLWKDSDKIQPSDVWILGYHLGNKTAEFDKFKRAESKYRFCLTPYFQNQERYGRGIADPV